MPTCWSGFTTTRHASRPNQPGHKWHAGLHAMTNWNLIGWVGSRPPHSCKLRRGYTSARRAVIMLLFPFVAGETLLDLVKTWDRPTRAATLPSQPRLASRRHPPPCSCFAVLVAKYTHASAKACTPLAGALINDLLAG